MQKQGMKSLFPIEKIGLIGMSAILLNIRKLYHYINLTADAINHAQPDIVIFIDVPDFSIRVKRRIDPRIPAVQYVAPLVWVGRKKRAKNYAKLFDMILTLMPFEPAYFNRHGGNAIYVGHDLFTNPYLQNADGKKIRSQLLAKLPKMSQNPKIIALLLGSRAGEVKNLSEIFLKTADRIAQENKNIAFVIPTFKPFKPEIMAHLKAINPKLSIMFITDEQEKFNAMAAADMALAASGTVSLHLAALKCPHIIGYKIGFINWCIWKIIIGKVNLFNIISGKNLVPEYIQYQCTVPKLAKALMDFTPAQQRKQIKAITPIIESFKPPTRDAQNDYVASLIIDMMRHVRAQSLRRTTQ